MSEGFMEACRRDEIADGGVKLVEVDETLVILFRQGDEVFCIDDVCTHDGGTLSEGEVDGCQIACPRHGAKFDLCSGKALTMPATQDTRKHDVRMDGDAVMVRLVDE